MLCQSCGKRNATVRIKNIVNGEMTELLLCRECAAYMGYAIGGNASVDFRKMLDTVLQRTEKMPVGKEERCPVCGCTFAEISKAGKLGCSHCYEAFSGQLQQTLNHLYGDSHYIGRVPASASKKAQLEEEIQKARKALADAIAAEDFEQAVVLRDQIRRAEEARNRP